MEAVLKFSLPEDNDALLCAQNGMAYKKAILEFAKKLRKVREDKALTTENQTLFYKLEADFLRLTKQAGVIWE